MSTTERWILTVYAVIVGVWPVRHVVITFIYNLFDILTRQSPRMAASNPPLVSAIIPAKDEEATIGDCLASVCAQDYPHLEILVVDDRSTDGTAAVIQKFAALDPRVRLIAIHDLPAGWTGKTHALHEASKEARGDWFWYLDADTRHAPESLAVMMGYAERNHAPMVSLLPLMRCESFWERVIQPLAGIVLVRSYPLFTVNNNRKKLAFANGQYILIRQDVYHEAGGHAAVRDRFVEDIGMARRVKALGHPIRVAISTDISSTRMYTNLAQLNRGWSRILYDASDRSVLSLGWKILEPLIFSQTGEIAVIAAPLLMLLSGPSPFSWWLLGLGVLHQILKTSVLWRMYRWSSPEHGAAALWYPLGNVMMVWICLKSIMMCLTGRVTWRGTAYASIPSGMTGTGADHAG